MTSYLPEPVDALPFGTPEKARRYATERYRGAVGLNWYRADPTLRALMRRYLGAPGEAWAAPHLERIGALMGGPIAERAEETDRHPPRLERYDRWGHDVTRAHLGNREPLAKVVEPAEDLERFKELWDDALVDERVEGP